MEGQDKQQQETAQPAETPQQVELVDIAYFSKLKLKVATVLIAERVPDTDKLMKLSIDLGDETRTLVAGIALAYAPEDLPGKQIIVIANLKPAKLRGITSQGMLLAAKDANGLSLLTVESPVAAGSGIS